LTISIVLFVKVCRLAYELMQTRYPDASRHFKSLDDIFYFGGQNAHSQLAIRSHTAQSDEEISFDVGDYIGIAGNHWNGYSKGINRRTGAVGLYPSYKVIDLIEVEDFLFDEQFENDSR
jgi:glycoprotein 6-alpha-L-fucosyltransferase